MTATGSTTDPATSGPGAAPPRGAAIDGLLGGLVADAIALPVHWYYDTAALDRDYPALAGPGPLGYLAPKNPHPDSILWRSHWTPPDARHDILGAQAAFWGRRGVHYHQFLAPGGTTLNFRLAVELFRLVRRSHDYDPERWLDRYVAVMLDPAAHGDTYVEEYHRYFFDNLAAGRKPINCGVRDVHIGGLVPVPALVAALGPRHPDLRRIVRLHVSLTHKDDAVLAAADACARILARISRDDRSAADRDLRTAILEEAPDWISAAKISAWERRRDDSAACPDRAVVGAALSPACYIDEAFPAALYLAWRHAGDFAAGVRANALCGGDSCHRGAVVGSLLGASAPIPPSLAAGLHLAADVTAVLDSTSPGPFA